MSAMATERLGDLASVVTKGTTPTSVNKKFAKEGIPFLRINNFNDGVINFDDVLFVDQDVHDGALRRSRIMPGDFLITIAGTIGKTLIVPSNSKEMNCNQAIAIIRVRDSVDKNYLKYWLETNDAKQQITGAKVTATISNLSLSQIKELKVPLPKKGEQKRIAAILDKADAIRRKRQQAIELADEFLRSVFLDMFGDPVEGWRELPFSTVALDEKNSFVNGPFGSNLLTRELCDSGVPVLYIQDIRSGRFERVSTRHVTPAKAVELKASSVAPGDVLIAKVGDPPGTAAIYPLDQVPAIVTQDVVRIQPDCNLATREFLVSYLNSEIGKRWLTPIIVEATRSRFGLGELKKRTISLPPVRAQKEFSKIFQHMTIKREKLLLSLNEANELFSSLSTRVFATGKV